ncbi:MULTISPECIES: amidohydrolase family protein [Alcaligenaceae]|uniref:amidohydrolase family protein n=1 Tax=Bordetella genomosp. 10 TaxID=1416804 RepID=UPI0015C5A4A6|nr:amidohydrolase family protein [Bordetella genomosp. 10]
MLITDTQVHLWEAHRPDRPWPAEEIERPVFVAYDGARPHREEPLQAEEFIATMDAAGVRRAIIVPPSPVGDDNLTALEAAVRYPERLAIMGRFNPEADGARERIENWLAQPGMLGIRLTFHKPKWSGWLEEGSQDWFWAACERLGIPLMVFVPGLVDKIPRIAQRHPALKLVLDHMARKSNLRDDACFADLDELLALARYENVHVKMSSAPCYSTQPYPFGNIEPYLRRIFDAFGPRRTMWGSDYTRLPCTYQECVDHFLKELDFLRGEDLEWVMGKAAAQVLDWPEPAAR